MLQRFSPFLRRIAREIRQTMRHRVRLSETFEPLVQYVDDFEGFCRDILGVKLWQGQIDIGNLVRDHDRVSVAACFASGKTFTAACLSLWWLFTRKPAMVVTTAPTGRQVRTLLWREIGMLHRKALVRLGGRVLQTRLEIEGDWFGMGFASDGANSVAGLHVESNVLFIEDEAAGMEAHIVEGFEGITVDASSRHLKIGNPITNVGPFYDSHMHPEESKRWKCYSIDAEDTPNVIAGKKIVPGLVERKWVEDKRKRWLERGLLHLWETRVKGKFHTTSGSKVIPEAWTALAQARYRTASANGCRRLGVDIAGGGRDSSVAYLRTGALARMVDEWQEENSLVQARRIADLAIAFDVELVVMDATGEGHGVYDSLVDLQEQGYLPYGIQVLGLKLNESPDDRDTFPNLSDELQWKLRVELSPEHATLAIDPDDKPLSDELSWREWHRDPKKGKTVVDGKRELKRRSIYKSPDHADALSLCCVDPPYLELVA